jgi:hypothetical protein
MTPFGVWPGSSEFSRIACPGQPFMSHRETSGTGTTHRRGDARLAGPTAVGAPRRPMGVGMRTERELGERARWGAWAAAGGCRSNTIFRLVEWRFGTAGD